MAKIDLAKIEKQQNYGKQTKVCIGLIVFFAILLVPVAIFGKLMAITIAIPLIAFSVILIKSIIMYQQEIKDLRSGNIYLVEDEVIDKKKITGGETVNMLILKNSISDTRRRKADKDKWEDGFEVSSRMFGNIGVGDHVYMIYGRTGDRYISLIPEKAYDSEPYDVFPADEFRRNESKPSGYDYVKPEEEKTLITQQVILDHFEDILHQKYIDPEEKRNKSQLRKDLENGDYYIEKDIVTDRDDYIKNTGNGADGNTSIHYYVDTLNYQGRFKNRIEVTKLEIYQILHMDDTVYLVFSRVNGELITVLSGEEFKE